MADNAAAISDSAIATTVVDLQKQLDEANARIAALEAENQRLKVSAAPIDEDDEDGDGEKDGDDAAEDEQEDASSLPPPYRKDGTSRVCLDLCRNARRYVCRNLHARVQTCVEHTQRRVFRGLRRTCKDMGTCSIA